MSEVFAMPIVGSDDTHLRTLVGQKQKGTFRGHVWCFVGTDGTPGGPEQVAFGYAPSWKAEEIQPWFATIGGMVQGDGYSGFGAELELDNGEAFVAVPDVRRLGCMMHVRSKFHAALLGKDRRAAVAIEHIGKLYELEAHCKASAMDAAARGAYRREHSLPILDAFDKWVDELHPRLLPKSPLRIATQYAINQRVFVRRCFEDGRFEIDNGRTERRIRTVAVSRRGFLFTGSVRGGERLAIGFTLVDNCLILGIDPQVYLEDVLTKLGNGWPMRRLSELTPGRWKAQKALEKREPEAETTSAVAG
jgi:hypothetical protein